jgi:hypothetical protein
LGSYGVVNNGDEKSTGREKRSEVEGGVRQVRKKEREGERRERSNEKRAIMVDSRA